MTPHPERLNVALADRDRIGRELGQGGMAVYLAGDLKHRRKVALEVLQPEQAAVLGADRFVQEITTTAALQHPHILIYLASFPDTGRRQRFLIRLPNPEAYARGIDIVLNWFAVLRARPQGGKP